MPTYTVFSDTSDGEVYSSNTTYSTARSGSNLATSTTLTQDVDVGQTKLNTNSTFYCYEGFVQFDTSGVIGTVVTATLSLYVNLDWDALNNWTINARLYDWGTSITTADWVAGADLSAKTLLASFATSGLSTTDYNAFTSEAAFKTNVNQSGSTRLILSSSRFEAGTTPAGIDTSGGTGDERVFFYSADQSGTTNDPKLVVVTSHDAVFVNMAPRIPAEAY